MGFGLKKPEGTAGAAWPAIAVGLFVAFGGGCVIVQQTSDNILNMHKVFSLATILEPLVIFWPCDTG